MQEMPGSYDTWRTDSGYEEPCSECKRPGDAAHTAECSIALEQDRADGQTCVYCTQDAKHTVDGEGVCNDCLSEEPDDNGPPDSYWSHDSGPAPISEQHRDAHELSKELHR